MRFNEGFPVEPGLAVCWGEVKEESISRLFPLEREAIRSSVIKRQREYASARCLARDAIRSLGFSECEVLNREDRSAIWPSGLVGSLSHCDNYAVAAVGLNKKILSVGCDVEPDLPLPEEIFEYVLHPAEIDSLKYPSDSRLIFSAKEAFYKAQHPVTATYLDFLDVAVRLYHTRNSFLVRLNKPSGSWKSGSVFRGKWLKVYGHIITLIYMYNVVLEKPFITSGNFFGEK